ncbi:hypothetical protein FBQ83_12870 [Chloroflexi bacterium CFX5]|nr:hypothetical protein [Chloroflexi bacterium CFX5]
MKKISFLVIVTSILSACSISPQVTVTPEATATLTATQTPTPEPTPTPDPAQIAAEEMGKLNLVLDTDYTLAPDADGNLAAFDKAGVKIYEPATNLWNSHLIAKIVENSLKITGDCEKTPFPASTNIMDNDFSAWYNDLFYTRAVEAGMKWEMGIGTSIIIHPFRSVPGNCWGIGVSRSGMHLDRSHTFFYPNSNGEVQLFRLFNPEK